MKKLFLLASAILFLNSCGGSKKTASNETQNKSSKITKNEPEIINSTENKNLDFATLRYIAKYADVAKKEMKDFGVPASITMAQGILESQSGKSRLAKEGNNHFGIKCHNDWHGEKILHDDNKAQECFRKYNNPEESFKDHSKFLANRKRYAFLFRLPKTDYEAWARGLKKAGYATDPSYPDKLIYIINKYNLAKMDKDVLKQMSVKVNEDETHQKDKKKKFIYEVKEGETLFTIARKFNVPVKDIQRINNLNDFDIYQGQILVLTENEELETPASTVENKKNETSNYQNISGSGMNDTSNESITSSNKNDNPNNDLDLHIVKQGETLFLISKTYHVDIEKLRKINHLSGNEIRVGSVIKVPKQAKGNIRKDISEKEPSVKKSNTSTANETDAVYHVVQPGETLYRIHVNYHVSINKLRKLNHLKGNYIKVGQKLRIK